MAGILVRANWHDRKANHGRPLRLRGGRTTGVYKWCGSVQKGKRQSRYLESMVGQQVASTGISLRNLVPFASPARFLSVAFSL